MHTEYVPSKRKTLFSGSHFAITEGFQQLLFVCLFSLLYIARDLLGINFPDIVFSGLCGIAFGENARYLTEDEYDYRYDHGRYRSTDIPHEMYEDHRTEGCQ